jgi:hypothetical protein
VLRWSLAFWICTLAVTFGIGVWFVADGLTGLPRTYARLDKTGVRTMGTVVRCQLPATAPSRGDCTVSVTFRGRILSVKVADNDAQLKTADAGTKIRMIADPRHPLSAYDAYDVEHAGGDGWVTVVALGGGFILFGLVLLFAPILL